MNKRSSSLSHKLTVYPTPRNFKIAIAFSATQNISKAHAVNKMIGHFIDTNFNQAQQEKLLSLYDKMSKSEKERPAKVNTDKHMIVAYRDTTPRKLTKIP